MEWSAETRIQIGDPAEPPWHHLEAFLAGFVAGLEAAGASQPTVLGLTADGPPLLNPTRRVQFGLVALDEDAARRLAQHDLFQAGLNAGVAALPAEARGFGWMASTEVSAAAGSDPSR